MTLELDGLSHRYGSELAVDDVSFALKEGELVALLGPSGCGKTTLVRAIAGHLRPTAGRVRLRGIDVTDAPPERREVGIVFQRSTLYPHMSVGENVAYGLDARGVDPDRRSEIVEEYLALVELGGKRDASPEALSGGQRRRVELARALAPNPDVLLLDEPLSALDRSLRGQLREEIARIQRETGVTTLFVTHDQEEALSLADRIVILHDGRVSATGDPRRLYESPPNRFVASFLGRSNLIPASVETRDPPRLRVGGTTVRVAEATVRTGETLPSTDRPEPAVHVRPADLVIGAEGSVDGDAVLSGTVRSVTDVASRYDVAVELDSGTEVTVERRRPPPAPDDRVAVGVDAAALTVLPNGSGEPGVADASAEPGTTDMSPDARR